MLDLVRWELLIEENLNILHTCWEERIQEVEIEL